MKKRVRIRHCERSEAIQRWIRELWIASSRSLSSGAHSRDPLAPRNDGKNTTLLYWLHFEADPEEQPSRRMRRGILAPPLDPEDDRQGETQSLIGDQRRRLRHRIGAPDHGKRGFIESRIARSLDDGGRQDMAHPVKREADNDLGALLRALR